jgi:hypothetical protein
MKKNLKNFITALLIAMPVLVSSPSFADNNSEPQAVVKFVGYKNAQPVYCLSINNPDNDKLTITIKDQDGVLLYEENVNGNYISKNFLLNRDDLGDNTIYFEISKNAEPVITKIKIQGELEK